jgi:hypothetical protein
MQDWIFAVPIRELLWILLVVVAIAAIIMRSRKRRPK